MNSKARKIIHIIVDVLIIAVLIISVITLVAALSSRASGGIPNLFGKAPIGVLTNSMHGDKPDSFDEGDMIICDKVDYGDTTYQVGDVVTFMQDISGDGKQVAVTHRIVAVNEDGSFRTQGDNNPTYDQDPANSVVFPDIKDYDILAVYHGTRIPKVGAFINLLQTPVGFFWIILFPMILFFLYQAVRVVMNAMAYSKEKGIEQAKAAVENAELTEEQKQRAIAEYLAQQKAQASEKPVSEETND